MPILIRWSSIALLALPVGSVVAQDAMAVPAFVSGSVRLVLRPGDVLQLGRFDTCERPAGLSEAQIDAVYADSILLRTTAGQILLRAGEGDALATGYRPFGAPPPPAGRVATVMVTGLLLGAVGVVLGSFAGFVSYVLSAGLFPAEPFVILGVIVGGATGLALAAELDRMHEPVSARLPSGWGQLELRRDVRAASCEFRPVP